jgi:hypothetical protein
MTYNLYFHGYYRSGDNGQRSPTLLGGITIERMWLSVPTVAEAEQVYLIVVVIATTVKAYLENDL